MQKMLDVKNTHAHCAVRV